MSEPSNPLDLQVSRVFTDNKQATTRFVLNEGGTRSTKTYSIAQLFLWKMVEHRNEPLILSVVRKTFPALRATAMRDFFDILKQYDVYDPSAHNQSNHTYRIGETEVEFFSIDDAQKMRGRKRDYLWINEANEISAEEFFQLNIRTNKQIFMDYNPSEIVHWLYTHDTVQKDCTLIHSTYLDNPFLDPELVKQIESLEGQDQEYWNVYGLGKRARSKRSVYSNYDVCQSIPELSDTYYGLDFGYNAPTALIRCDQRENEIWEQELLYQTALTNAELIERLKTLVPKDAEIWADGEAPDRIQEIYNAGFHRTRASKKGKGSVKNGIDIVKRYAVHILNTSTNLIEEKQKYKWKVDKEDNVIDEPVKFKDHAMDAERYAISSHNDPTMFEGAVSTNEDPMSRREVYQQIYTPARDKYRRW